MKYTAAFLVLFMIVLMAEPGECIFGLLFNVGKLIHGLITRRRGMDVQEVQLDKRSLEDYRPGRLGVH
ncbi:pleurocidin-like peptide WF3 [Chaetodon trifascialis]|uniref:pleurocidin-like peptide WF3 n=1 Tax=Chaetodon trifascialis TaxID=109706 RepID=UPI003993244C